MAQGIAPCGKLPALYELETEFCIGAFRCHVGDVLGRPSFGV